jgi:hypothetical protein
MKKSCMLLIILLTGFCTLAQMGRPARAEAGVIKTIVFYVPNRVFDLMDIFRVRVRVGPGISAGVRATRPLSAFVGLHSTVFIGLPGPRGSKKLPLPVGLDMRAGAQVSVADASAGTPYYDPLEVGFEVQPLFVGVNIGVGGFEILDFLAGLVFIDLQDDDFGKSSKKDDDEKSPDEAEAVEEVEKEEPTEEVEEVKKEELAEEVEEVKKEEPAEEVEEVKKEEPAEEVEEVKKEEPAEEVEEVKNEEPAPSEENKEPAEEVEAIEKEEPAPSEEAKEPAKEVEEVE